MPSRGSTVLVALTLTACGSRTPVPSDDLPMPARPSPLASIERTSCYGYCPDYKVDVFADGRIEYEGSLHVKVKGRHEGRISQEAIQELRATFEKFGYARFKDSYERYEVTDNPTVTTSYGSKTIIHYHGDRSAPASLSQLEDEIDRIIDVERWIGTVAERKALWLNGE